MVRFIRGVIEVTRFLAQRRGLNSDQANEPLAQSIQQSFGKSLSPQEVVDQIIRDVGAHGDSAIRNYTRLLEGLDLLRLEIPREEWKQAYEHIPLELVEALKIAAERIEIFHRRALTSGWIDHTEGLGQLLRPLKRIGIYVPGGTASYPSTVLMTAIPARIAGVSQIIIATPSLDGSIPHPAVLVAADIAGVNRVFQIGGAQAVVALARGTESVPCVDKVCGPGNIFVTLAKRAIFGNVDIDGLYGPTETVLVADDLANPALCAADLLAQAEHDPLASPILLTTSDTLAKKVCTELSMQIEKLERKAIASLSLQEHGMVAVLENMDQTLDIVNLIAPEHLCLLVKDPWALLDKIENAGGIFLGEASPEAIGDYVAGPSHVMPTGGTARFNSALSVHHFQKVIPVVGLDAATLKRLGPAAVTLARAEGLTGHAKAIELRLREYK